MDFCYSLPNPSLQGGVLNSENTPNQVSWSRRWNTRYLLLCSFKHWEPFGFPRNIPSFHN